MLIASIFARLQPSLIPVLSGSVNRFCRKSCFLIVHSCCHKRIDRYGNAISTAERFLCNACKKWTSLTFVVIFSVFSFSWTCAKNIYMWWHATCQHTSLTWTSYNTEQFDTRIAFLRRHVQQLQPTKTVRFWPTLYLRSTVYNWIHLQLFDDAQPDQI